MLLQSRRQHGGPHRGQPGADTVFAEACDQFQHICRFADDLTLVGQTPMTGAIATHALNMPMIMLNVICELRAYSEDATFEKDRAATCLEQIKMHVHADRRAVLETVAADGALDGAKPDALVPLLGRQGIK